MEVPPSDDRKGPWGLVAFVVFGLAQGIIPYTHTIQFGPGMATETKPSTMPLWRDVLNAAGIGLLVNTVCVFALSACFISLCRAYGEEALAPAVTARRALRRRVWLYPLMGQMGLGAMLALFLTPVAAGGLTLLLMLVSGIVPLVYFMVGLKRGADSAGVPGGWGWLVVLVPIILAYSVDALLLGMPPGGGMLEAWLPPMIAGDG